MLPKKHNQVTIPQHQKCKDEHLLVTSRYNKYWSLKLVSLKRTKFKRSQLVWFFNKKTKNKKNLKVNITNFFTKTLKIVKFCLSIFVRYLNEACLAIYLVIHEYSPQGNCDEKFCKYEKWWSFFFQDVSILQMTNMSDALVHESTPFILARYPT